MKVVHYWVFFLPPEGMFELSFREPLPREIANVLADTVRAEILDWVRELTEPGARRHN